jgi:hypothetical protein
MEYMTNDHLIYQSIFDILISINELLNTFHHRIKEPLLTNKQQLLSLALIVLSHCAPLFGVSGYPKGSNLARCLCLDTHLLAMLNNQKPKVVISLDGSLLIQEGLLWQFVEKTDKPEIHELKRLSSQFNNRPNKKIFDQHEDYEAHLARIKEEDQKYFNSDEGYDQASCDSFLKAYEEKTQKYLDQLEPENKQLFDQCSQLLDTICAQHQDEIESFKKEYEDGMQRLRKKLEKRNPK